MKGLFGILILSILTATHVVHAQTTTTSLRDLTGFGPCNQCRVLGNSQELVPCSDMWRQLLQICSSPQCSGSMASLQSPVFNINDCTATPPPLPGGTEILSWPGSPITLEGTTFTLTFGTVYASSIITTSSTTTTSSTITTPSTTTTSSTTITSSTTTTSTTVTTSTSTASQPTTTVSTVSETTTLTTPFGISTASSSTSSSNSAGPLSTGGAAIGSAPGWAEGVVFLAGWIFAL